MTRKDYNRLAQIIGFTHERMVSLICDTLEDDSKSFDRNKFIEAVRNAARRPTGKVEIARGGKP